MSGCLADISMTRPAQYFSLGLPGHNPPVVGTFHYWSSSGAVTSWLFYCWDILDDHCDARARHQLIIQTDFHLGLSLSLISHLSACQSSLSGPGNQQQWILSGSWSQLFCSHWFLETFTLGGSNLNPGTVSRRITRSQKTENRESIKTTMRITTRDRKCPGMPSETANSPSHSNPNWWKTLRMMITSLMLQSSRSSSNEMLTLILNWSPVISFRSWFSWIILMS